MGRTEELADWRHHRRVPVTGFALWSARREEGRCDVFNLSIGGAEISNPTISIEPGELMSVALWINDRELEPTRVEVVRMTTGGLGLRFADPAPGFQQAVEDILLADVKDE